MNIQELIKYYCKNDIEFTSIGHLIKRVREKGKSYPNIKTVYAVSNTKGLVNAEEFRDHTIHSENTSNYTVVKEGMFAYNPARLNIGSIGYLKTDISGLVSPMYVVFNIDENKITKEYLFAFIKSKYCSNKIESLTENGARFRFEFERWSLISIPIPPLPVQAEIVRILDTFTELTSELTAELTARKKQYNFYREQLLMVNDKGLMNNEKVEWKTLGEMCKIGDGLHGTPKYNNSGEYYFINGNNLDNGIIVFNDKTNKVDESMFKKHGIDFTIEKTVFLSINGTIGSVSLYNNEKIVLGKSVAFFNIESLELNSKYLYYFLQTNYSKNYYEAEKTGSTIKNLGLKALRNFSIPVPSLEEQARIVSILDTFDTLTISISEGLPKEIELRKKQYEYYRDWLLTFGGNGTGDM